MELHTTDIAPTKVRFDRHVYEQFRLFTKLYAADEWGGLAIGYREDTAFHVRAIVLPPQKIQSGAFCEFRKELFPVVSSALVKLSSKHRAFDNYRVGVWIHTHPGFGPFLSGTDHSSFKYLTQLSKDFLAVVVDPISNNALAFNGTVAEAEQAKLSDTGSADSIADSEQLENEPKKATEEFTQIEMTFDSGAATPIADRAFLDDFRRAVESREASTAIGDTSRIEVFVPMEEMEFTMRTMAMRLEYCERRLAEIEQQPEFKYNQRAVMPYLIEFSKAADMEDTLIPRSINVNAKGILLSWYSGGSIMTNLFKWQAMKDVNVVTLLEREAISQGYRIPMVFLAVNVEIRTRGWLFPRGTSLSMLVCTSDAAALFDCLMTYFPGATLTRAESREVVKPSSECRSPDDEDQDDTIHNADATDENVRG